MEIISLENLILRKKYDLRTYLGDNPSEDGFDYLMDLITFPDLIISVTKKRDFFFPTLRFTMSYITQHLAQSIWTLSQAPLFKQNIEKLKL